MTPEELTKKYRLDLDSTVRNGMFILEDGEFHRDPYFKVILETRFNMKKEPDDEELLYRAMLSIREFAPDLLDEDFLAARRVVMQYAFGVREAWKKVYPKQEAEPAEEREKRVGKLKAEWVKGFKKGQKQDMLTLVYEMQLENARKIIGSSGNFQPELLMWRQRSLTGTTFVGPDPITQAIALVQQAQPEGYSFAAEAWTGHVENYRQWGDMAKLESKEEALAQTCTENRGPQLSRLFQIDRAKATLIPDPPGNQSRMPRQWKIDDIPPRWADSKASGPYA